jgi:hypothetical protein
VENFTYEQPLIFVAGLDGPIVRGSAAQRARLYDTLVKRLNSVLVYVTERYLESARAFQEIMHLPRPDVFVTDMGSSVAPGQRDRSISVIDQELNRNWPGSEKILARLEALDHLIDPHPFQAPHRMSFVTRDAVTTDEVIPKAQQLLDELDVRVMPVDSIQLDVLPEGVSLKHTVDRVLSWIDADQRWRVVVVVGSPDDMDLVEDSTIAIAAVEPDEPWAQEVSDQQNVQVASPAGCEGIYEAMIQLGLIESGETKS